MLVSTSLNPRYIARRPHYTPPPYKVTAPVKPLQLSPKYQGYEIDADELALELCVPLPEGLLHQPAYGIDPDELGNLYHWFLS